MKYVIRALVAALVATAMLAGLPTAASADVDPLAAWKSALSQSDAAQANVVWLGSSTTYGTGASSAEKRYVNIATDRLRGGVSEPVNRPAANYPTRNTTPGVHGYVSAAGGTTSENYVNDSTRPWILWERPTLIVHMIGSNDSIDAEPYAVTPAEYEANVAAEVDKLNAGSSQPISQVLVHTYRRQGVSMEKWAQYRDALERIASTRPNVLVLDISGEYEAADHLGADPRDLIGPDGVHQTDAGHAFMAELIAEVLGATVESTPAPTPTTQPVPVPATTAPAPVVVPAAPAVPDAKAPRAPRRVSAVERSRGVVVSWRKVFDADTYQVKCGSASKVVRGSKVSLRADAKRCSVKAVNAAGSSPWTRARVV